MTMAYRTTVTLDATGLKQHTRPSRCTLANYFDKRIQREDKLLCTKPRTECTLQRS